MGYEVFMAVELWARLDKHGGPEQEIDDEALDRFKKELKMMIKADPDYERIFGDQP